MKKALFLLLLMVTSVLASASTYERQAARMNDYFNHAEWNYVLVEAASMIKQRPSDVEPYALSIIAAQFMEDIPTENYYLKLSQSNLIHVDSLLTLIYVRTKQLHNADIYEQLLLNLKKNNKWLSRVFDIYLLDYYHFARKTKETIKIANELLNATPNNVRFIKIKADALFYQGDTREAVQLYEKLLQIDPNDYETLTLLSAYYSTQDLKTIHTIDSIYLNDPKPVDSLYMAGKQVIIETRIARTIDLMKRANKIRPSDHLINEIDKLNEISNTLPKRPSSRKLFFKNRGERQ